MKALRTPFLSFVLAAGLAAPAWAQCTWFVQDAVDLDQRRMFALPGDGAMYCAPTSFTNWFAYLANRGIPQPLVLDGPRNWEDNANYDHVSNVLTFMGTLMETDPDKGTRGHGLSGAQAYVAFAASGDLIVCGGSIWSDSSYRPTPQKFLDLHNLGAYIISAYGRYGSSTGGTRAGGHVITPTGVWDLGCGQAPILQFSDPADDPANGSQSKFRTSLGSLTAVTGQFRPKSSASFSTKTLYRLDTDVASTQFLDETFAIMPTSAILGGSSGLVGQLELYTPFRPAGNPLPATRMYNTATGSGNVLDVAAGADPLERYYITSRTGAQNAGAWKLDLATGISTRLTVNNNPTRIVVGRLGDLYVLDTDGVNRYDLSTTPATLISTFAPSTVVEALAYDDKDDTVLMLTEAPPLGARRVLTFPRTLTGFGTNRALPVSLGGVPCIEPDASAPDTFFVCASGSPSLSRITFSTALGSLTVIDTITHINGALTGLNVTDSNRLIYAVNGVLTERERNQQGDWVIRAGSRWAGRTVTGQVSIARTRDTFLNSFFDDDAFNNLSDPTVYPGFPVCYPNCDGSTASPILNALDFACFLTKFAAQQPYANCDNSTASPILNALDFGCFLTKFAAGCT